MYFCRTTTSIKLEKCHSTLPLQEGIGLIFKSYFHMSLLFGDEINSLFVFFAKSQFIEESTLLET